MFILEENFEPGENDNGGSATPTPEPVIIRPSTSDSDYFERSDAPTFPKSDKE